MSAYSTHNDVQRLCAVAAGAFSEAVTLAHAERRKKTEASESVEEESEHAESDAKKGAWSRGVDVGSAPTERQARVAHHESAVARERKELIAKRARKSTMLSYSRQCNVCAAPYDV